MKWEYKRCIRSASVKWFCFTTFQIEIDYTAFPHNETWSRARICPVPPLFTDVDQSLGSVLVTQAGWQGARCKMHLICCDSANGWFTDEVLEVREPGEVHHMSLVCVQQHQSLSSSQGFPPMWINLATRGERGRLSQKWKITEARRENKVLHWNGVKLSSQAKISLIIVCLLESGVTLSFKGKVWHF